MKNKKTMVKLLMAMVVGIALLGPAVAYSAATSTSSSCSCPCAASTSAQLFPQVGLSESVFYRPFVAMQQEMDRLNQDMNNMMQEAFYAPGNAGVGHDQLYSRINMETTAKEYRITMTAPGLEEKDLKVDVSPDNTLTIRSEKNLVQKTSTGTEHSFGSFTQMLTLPPDADATHVKTSFKNGEYDVTLPRKDIAEQPSTKSEGAEQSL
jgi:HSP20 family molecular chaperone IbpA